MKSILHISADFPDPLVPAKTRAVANLIDATGWFRHIVYSLNRVSWRSGISRLPFSDDRVALAYGAPPYGIGLVHYLRPVAGAILADLACRGVVPDLIHAHKFSVEGIIAAELAVRLRRPFIASLWGNSDITIFEAKRTLKDRYREIAGRASLLLPAAPWTADYFAKALSLDGRRFQILPIITTAETILPPRIAEAPRFVTALSLDSWRCKGLDTLARAAVLLKTRFPDLLIDVYGGGSPTSLFDVQRMIRHAGAERQMRLMGPSIHGAVQQTMNGYTAFLMPSRHETYGMVYVEAVLAGVPILWSRGRGIDGLLNGCDVGYTCDPSSVEDVVAGIKCLLDRETHFKQNISRLQSAGAFEHLRRSAISARYSDLIARVLREDFPDISPLRGLAADSLQSESESSYIRPSRRRFGDIHDQIQNDMR
jgi:glycosyltransferase involved in cell wall biosynthesis